MEKRKQQWHDRMIVLVLVGMMLPFPIACAGIVVALGYFVTQVPVKQVYRWTPMHRMLHVWFLISLIASLVSGNSVGIAATVAVYMLYVYLLYYRQYARVRVIEKLIDVMLSCSVCHAIYAYLQHKHVLYGPDYHAWHSALVSWKDGRADSVFLNPNYYAMACGLFVLLACYKLTQHPKLLSVLWYSVVIVANSVGLILTQTRVAIPALLVSVVVFLYCYGSRQTKRLVMVVSLLGLLCLPLLQQLPRFSFGDIHSHLGIRLEIWQTSWRHFLKTSVMGSGPLTYMNIYSVYGSYATQHAHNLVLDSLLNYGVLGTGALMGWLWYMKPMVRRLKELSANGLYALVVSFLVLTFTFGLMDVTIFWVQTLFIVMSILMAIPIYLREHTMH